MNGPTDDAGVVLVNLTPHVVVLHGRDGAVTIEPSGTVARVQLIEHELEPVRVAGTTVPIVTETLSTVDDLPAPRPGTVYITSRIVAERAPHRTDVLVPTRLIRNDDGSVRAAGALAQLVSSPAGDPQGGLHRDNSEDRPSHEQVDGVDSAPLGLDPSDPQ